MAEITLCLLEGFFFCQLQPDVKNKDMLVISDKKLAPK